MVITSADQVTPDWLTQVLRKNGHLDQGKVITVRPSDQEEAIPAGPGFHPSHQLRVRYSPDAPATAPSRLYLKTYAGEWGKQAGTREIIFYDLIAASMPDPPVVTCYDSAYDPEVGAYHLLLEDVSETHGVVVEREAPARKPDAERMIDALAWLHACWWNHPRLEREIRLVDGAVARDEWKPDFSGFVDYMGDRLSDERRCIYERILGTLPSLLGKRFTIDKGLTVVHDDAHPWNFLLPWDRADGRTYLVDWQQWGASAGPHDVSYMLTLFWYRERRARMERDLVRRYHERLLAHGVTGYDWDTCWQDYRLFTMRNLLVVLWAWEWSHPRRGHWGFHRWMQFEKGMLAFQDLECEELLG